MKLRIPALVLVAGLGSLLGAGEPGADPIVPQPRLRLQPTPQGPVAIVKAPAKEPDVVTLDKMVVTESKLPLRVPRREAPEPAQFTLLTGGPIASGKIGDLPVEAGLWAWRDVFAEDARFDPPKGRIDLEFVRLKL